MSAPAVRTIKAPEFPASEKQVTFIKKLIREREVPEAISVLLQDMIDLGTINKQIASDGIAWMLNCPEKPREPRTVNGDPVTEPGIYEHDGRIYKVQHNKAKTHLYALVLTMTVGEAKRLTAAGSTVKAEYQYEKGLIFQIQASNRITGSRAEELSIVFNSCIVCGRHLKAASSVKAGIGPVCATRV